MTACGSRISAETPEVSAEGVHRAGRIGYAAVGEIDGRCPFLACRKPPAPGEREGLDRCARWQGLYRATRQEWGEP